MTSTVVKYKVVGKYSNGREVSKYQLLGSDGTNIAVDKQRAIHMIDKGLIVNMRLQVSGDSSVIIRGKGINLNNLPVYNEDKGTYKNSKSANSIQAKPNMAKFTIVKRIMLKNACIGYTVSDINGNEKNIKRNEVLKLVEKGLILNAELSIYNNKDTGKREIRLNGIGCNLKELPKIILDSNTNKIVKTDKLVTGTVLRAAFMKQGGAIVNKVNGDIKHFEAGDFIIVGINGSVSSITKSNIELKFNVVKKETASCDYYLGNVKNYTVKFYNNQSVDLSKEMIIKWTTIEAK